jgi:TolA-binding protein
MMDYPLPRASKDKKSEIPQRSLGTGNHTPKFQNNLVADLDFIKYRSADEPPPQEIVRLQNYSNYQSVCLAQNIDDLAQDVLKTKGHMNGLHSDLDTITQNQEDLKQQINHSRKARYYRNSC